MWKIKKHRKTIFAVCAVLCLLVVTGCATPKTKSVEVGDVAAEIEAKKQRKIALEAWISDKRRLDDVAYGIFTRATPLCEHKSGYSTGIVIANKYMFAEDMREAALSLYDISNVLKIFHVIGGSAADRAGVKDNDIPVAVNDWPVPIGEKAGKELLENGIQKVWHEFRSVVCGNND
jgi:hypothetical protein